MASLLSRFDCLLRRQLSARCTAPGSKRSTLGFDVRVSAMKVARTRVRVLSLSTAIGGRNNQRRRFGVVCPKADGCDHAHRVPCLELARTRVVESLQSYLT